jgi:hypothetical protein
MSKSDLNWKHEFWELGIPSGVWLCYNSDQWPQLDLSSYWRMSYADWVEKHQKRIIELIVWLKSRAVDVRTNTWGEVRDGKRTRGAGGSGSVQR